MEKRLYRIKNRQAMLGGVSQGLAEYFNIDVTLIRVVFVLLFFTPFPAGFTYIVLWAVLPTKYDYGFAGAEVNPDYNSNDNINTQNLNSTNMSRHNQNGNLVGGAVLIILGVIFSFKTFFHINLWHYLGQMWPLFFIGLGIWLIIRDRKDDNFTNFTNNDSSSSL